MRSAALQQLINDELQTKNKQKLRDTKWEVKSCTHTAQHSTAHHLRKYVCQTQCRRSDSHQTCDVTSISGVYVLSWHIWPCRATATAAIIVITMLKMSIMGFYFLNSLSLSVSLSRPSIYLTFVALGYTVTATLRLQMLPHVKSQTNECLCFIHNLIAVSYVNGGTHTLTRRYTKGDRHRALDGGRENENDSRTIHYSSFTRFACFMYCTRMHVYRFSSIECCLMWWQTTAHLLQFQWIEHCDSYCVQMNAFAVPPVLVPSAITHTVCVREKW